ncbi:hypothetical protein TNCV_1622311 [Trichonephila clavipes]|nr:hypothetical protein TNCV_1622311 [Trichonephila clavipes]
MRKVLTEIESHPQFSNECPRSPLKRQNASMSKVKVSSINHRQNVKCVPFSNKRPQRNSINPQPSNFWTTLCRSRALSAAAQT